MSINFQSRKTTYILAGIAVTLFLIVGAVAYIFLIGSPSEKYKVIDFREKPLAEVETWLKDNEVPKEWYQISYEYDEEVPKDHIVSQNLKVEEYITKETPLKLKVSNGADPEKEIELIDFKGMKEEDIKKWFDDNKFTDVNFEYVLDEKIEKGQFVKINIDGNKAKRNAVILVSISAGKDALGIEITMPDFKDYTKANIQAWAKENMMSVTFKEESSTTVAKDKVISQSPKAGEKTKTGEKVTVTISTGTGITVKNQVGRSQADAIAWAKENGLKYSIKEHYSNKAKGTVISQSPSQGSLKEGSIVTFDVSVGYVPINNYTGKDKQEFVTYINGINSLYNGSAKINISFNEKDADKIAGTILDISINGKSLNGTEMVPPGTNIVVTVSKGKNIDVANYSGKSENDFKNYLNNNGLVAGSRQEQYHDSIGSGNIISNDTGNKPQGSSINYIVSIGAYGGPNADLYQAGKAFSNLQNEINAANSKGAGWTLNKQDAGQTSYEQGIITEACSVSGKTITCKVSSGAYVKVPSFDTNPCGSVARCSIDGLNYEVSTQTEHSDIPQGQVVSMDPAAGSSVAKGTTIKVVLSRGPKPIQACPADASGPGNGDCKCNNEDYEYDANSNSCILTYVTTPNVGLGILSSDSYDGAVKNVTNTYSTVGLANNLNFIKVSPEEADGSSPGIVKSIDPKPGARVRVDQTITVKIVG
ncbi:MAG: PASTA domain-containing protein [Erysipelotrichaceae bacterium]|nr:PASTA domain-containing protein [Erysipelotrichaceae bacterium]MDY5252514.1 PASTA domain-containing protein [Erysipelotrichaceae bacterium]